MLIVSMFSLIAIPTVVAENDQNDDVADFLLFEQELKELNKEFFDNDPMKRQETIELVRAYYKIPNRKAAKHLYDLIIAMSKTAYNGGDTAEEE